jgi:RNA polymerase-binding transcription factor
MTTHLEAAQPAASSATPARLRKLRAELHLQRRFRLGQLADLAAAVAVPPSPTDEAERQVACALAVAAESALSDIDDALQRFLNGSYGKCEHCAARIPFERLEALPMARFCMPCQYRRETSRLLQRPWISAE